MERRKARIVPFVSLGCFHWDWFVEWAITVLPLGRIFSSWMSYHHRHRLIDYKPNKKLISHNWMIYRFFFSGIYLLILVGANTAREKCLCSSIAWWPWNVSNEQSIIKLYSYCWISRFALHYSIMWCVANLRSKDEKLWFFFLTLPMYRPRIHLNHSFVEKRSKM